MRKLTVLFHLLFASLLMQAQTNVYHPFPDSNAVWRVDEWSNPPCAPPSYYCGSFYYALTGDTVIGSFTYHKINNSPVAIREDTASKKVFVINYCSSSDTLLYDFSLNVGDTLKQCAISGGTLIVTSIDSILVGSSYRKQFNVSGGYPFSIIEGIGSTGGLLGLSGGWIGGNNELTCFVQDKILLYDSGAFVDSCGALINGLNTPAINNIMITVFPNPIHDHAIFILHITNTSTVSLNIYNAIGNLIETVFNKKIGNEKHEINWDTKKYANGVYYYQLLSEQSIITGKIIIAK